MASAVGQAQATGKLLFIDFTAEWCGACQKMEATTFKDPTVISALQRYLFIKVDADLYPSAAQYFKVVGMPTLVVLGSSGQELYRQVGPIGAAELTQKLLSLPGG